MKKITMLFLIFPMFLMAQTRTQNWKFAAGVSLLNNKEYSSYQEKQPLEINARYAFQNKHVLRLSIPLAINYNVLGNPEAAKYDKDISPEEIAKQILAKNGDFQFNYFVAESKYNLYGVTVGYDYNYPLIDKLSVYAGMDLGFYFLDAKAMYYETSYNNESSNTNLSDVQSCILKRNFSNFSLEPFIGLRYQYQRLLLETLIGYNFNRIQMKNYLLQYTIYDLMDKSMFSDESKTKGEPYNVNKFVYALNLLYTF